MLSFKIIILVLLYAYMHEYIGIKVNLKMCYLLCCV